MAIGLVTIGLAACEGVRRSIVLGRPKNFGQADAAMTHCPMRCDCCPIIACLKCRSLRFLFRHGNDDEEPAVRVAMLRHRRLVISGCESEPSGDFRQRPVTKMKVTASEIGFALRQIDASHGYSYCY